jgi:alkylated DNA repair dioxygenase AlkB
MNWRWRRPPPAAIRLFPDACLINRYQPGAKLSLHQDKDEQDLRAPIVSVSLGLPAIFQFGGLQRSDPLQRLLLEHGDVVVWGGESRLFYHGIQPLKAGIIRNGRLSLQPHLSAGGRSPVLK